MILQNFSNLNVFVFLRAWLISYITAEGKKMAWQPMPAAISSQPEGKHAQASAHWQTNTSSGCQEAENLHFSTSFTFKQSAGPLQSKHESHYLRALGMQSTLQGWGGGRRLQEFFPEMEWGDKIEWKGAEAADISRLPEASKYANGLPFLPVTLRTNFDSAKIYRIKQGR